MAKFRRFSLRILIAVILGLVVLAAAHSLWLAALGGFLVKADGPAQADVGVVLAGDLSGQRILTGAELCRRGFVPAVIVSGPDGNYGSYECDLAIRFAENKGYPASYFVPLPNTSRSTEEEAQFVMRELLRRGAHSFLLITSNYHTRRAAKVYERIKGGLKMRVVAAPYDGFTPDGWWHSREARKAFFFEWSKTIGYELGL